MRPKTQVRFWEAENARVNTILKTNSVEQKAGAKIENKKKFERLTPINRRFVDQKKLEQ